MQSSPRSNPSTASFSNKSVVMELNEKQIGSRKRNYTEMTKNFDDSRDISKKSDEVRLSCDILQCFPRLVCECIFQHLDVKELLEASEVRKEWNEFVGERPQVEKLKIVFKGHNGDELRNEVKYILKKKQLLTYKGEEMMKNSARQYQNIEFETTSLPRSEFVLSFLRMRAGLWKSVVLKFWNCCYRDFLPEILGIIEPTVENLSIFSNKSLSSLIKKDAYSKWTFKHLKSLECYKYKVQEHDGFNFFEYFQQCSSLDKLRWESRSSGGESEAMIQSLRMILQNNTSLKELEIPTYDKFFVYSPEFKFKLRKLWIRNEISLVTNYLRPFLETQAQTLESLQMSVFDTRACLDLILGRMPRLTSLTASYCFNMRTIPNWTQELPVNTTITSLEVSNRWNDGIKPLYRTMLKALPRLKHFKSTKVTDKILRALKKHAPDLESIETEEFHVRKFPLGEIFPKIKKFESLRFREGMKEPTGNSKFEKLVAKEFRNRRGFI